MSENNSSTGSGKDQVSSFYLYRRLLSYALVYWGIFIVAIIGMIIFNLGLTYGLAKLGGQSGSGRFPWSGEFGAHQQSGSDDLGGVPLPGGAPVFSTGRCDGPDCRRDRGQLCSHTLPPGR